MIRKVCIAVLILCAFALAQPPQGGPGGPGAPRGAHFGPGGPHPGGEIRPMLPPGRWWKDAGIAKNLGLTDTQVQKIEQVFQESRLKLIDVHSNLQKEEVKLEPLLESENPDESAVLAAIDRITSARAAVEKANAQMAFAIRRVLNPDQWKKLHTMQPPHNRFAPPMCPPPEGGPHGGEYFQHNPHPQAPPADSELPAGAKDSAPGTGK